MTQSAQIEPSEELAAAEVGDRWALSYGGATMEVDPRRGARICSFSLNGVNVLTGPEVDADNYGSTFWTSPQSDWEWPPVPEVDSAEYAVVESDAGLVCCGSFSSKLGIIVTKRFSVVPARRAFRVEYEISNQSSETLRMAPWEISRVRGGLSFFRAGEPMEAPESHKPLPIQSRDGVSWYQYAREAVTEDQKLFAHSSGGWLAHLSQGLLLVKRFDVVPVEKQAPGEAMIEIFASGSKDYIEVEQQGPYSKIGPWKSLTWRVNWQLMEVPEGTPSALGSEELVRLVENELY